MIIMEREDYFFEIDENKSIRKVFVLIIYERDKDLRNGYQAME